MDHPGEGARRGGLPSVLIERSITVSAKLWPVRRSRSRPARSQHADEATNDLIFTLPALRSGQPLGYFLSHEARRGPHRNRDRQDHDKAHGRVLRQAKRVDATGGEQNDHEPMSEIQTLEGIPCMRFTSVLKFGGRCRHCNTSS